MGSAADVEATVAATPADAGPAPDGPTSDDGQAFQDALLEDGRVSRQDYESAVGAAVQCIRDAGFKVEFPAEDQQVVVDIAIDPDELLTFSVHVPAGVETGDRVLRCQQTWSMQVEYAWQEQLAPSDQERERAIEAALECGRERGQELTGSEETDAFRAVRERDCRPWEEL
ncbi:hypothetical protein FTX61_19760 [Nitriliruptoraceae bacterium ZYF776]|nr:hypothetical protein [Profundirhabdus halotolerans]